MLNPSHQDISDRPARNAFRAIVERIAILLWDEPMTFITQRQFARLHQLERREILQLAERMGNQDFLDRELEKAQPSVADLTTGTGLTPIEQWPDEDFEGVFGVGQTNEVSGEES